MSIDIEKDITPNFSLSSWRTFIGLSKISIPTSPLSAGGVVSARIQLHMRVDFAPYNGICWPLALADLLGYPPLN
jgi:hypothetical protein